MRYTPFERMERMLDQMRHDVWDWREGMGDMVPSLEGRSYGFNFDLGERDGEFVFTADLPGFERDEIDLRLDGDELVLSASHEVSDESSSRSRSISERLTIPKAVVEDEIEATYHNGVLEVHLPIVEGAIERGHRIDID